MSCKHCCVIDAQGNYIDLVQVITETDHDGKERETITEHVLAPGEKLLDVQYPNTNKLCKPRWNGEAWEESATKAELDAWEQKKAENTPPLPVGPSLPERVGSLEEQVTDTQAALAETYEQADTANTDVLMATAEVYEKLLALEGRVAGLEGGANANG